MREFIKSVFSFSWAMSLFGAQQLANVVNQSSAAKSLDNVKRAAEREFDDLARTTFAAGDTLQRRLVDLMFSALSMEPNRPPTSRKGSPDDRRGKQVPETPVIS